MYTINALDYSRAKWVLNLEKAVGREKDIPAMAIAAALISVNRLMNP